MSLIIQMVRCPKCGKKYSFNPDVGKWRCPNCFGLGDVLPKKRKRKREPKEQKE